MVVSTLLSGLTAFVCSTRDLQQLDSFVVGCLRKLLYGRACQKQSAEDGNVSYQASTNKEVHRLTGVAHVETELRVQRLTWLQRVAAHPDKHEQHITAMFAIMPFEKTDEPVEHPWLVQLKSDLQHVDSIESSAWMTDSIVSDPLALVRDACMA